MYIHICIYIYIHVCLYTCIYTYTYIYIYTSLSLSIYIYIYTHMYMCTIFHVTRFSPRVGLPRNLFLIGSLTAALRLSKGWVRKDPNLGLRTGCIRSFVRCSSGAPGSCRYMCVCVYLSLSLYIYIYIYIYI